MQELSKKVGILKIYPMIPADFINCVLNSDIDGEKL